MSWDEFCTLLSGIMPKTPLGQIISIRSEEDENMLKNFTEEQHKIRNDWRNRQLEQMTDEEEEAQIEELQEILRKSFSES